MDDKMAELYNKIEKIVEYKNDIETIQGNIEILKMQVVKDMADLQINQVNSFSAKAMIMNYERGTLNKELTKEGLEKATEGENVTVEDCKKYKHLNFLLVKRFR